MKVKVQCPCGSRFEFEVEPANGRMPVAINCPTCGADATELANEVIARQSVAAPAPPTPAPAPAYGLRIAKHAAAPTPSASAPAADAPQEPAAPREEASYETCHRHKTSPAVEHCRVCGKAICQECLEQFGYVCSIFCRETAAHKQIAVPVYAQQRGLVLERSHQRAKYIVMGVFALFAALVGAWAWYIFFARNPSVIYSLDLPRNVSASDQYYSLVSSNKLLSINNTRVSLQDLATGNQLWSAPFQRDADNDPSAAPRVIANASDVWVLTPNSVQRLDAKTGERKDVTLPDHIFAVTAGTDAILVASGSARGNETLTRISLADGSSQSEPITGYAPQFTTNKITVARNGGNGTGSPGMVQGLKGMVTAAAGQHQSAIDETPSAQVVDATPQLVQQLFDTGPSAVWFRTRLLEKRTIAHEAMRKPKGPSVLDNPNVTASQGMDLAEEMMNNSQREKTGGVEIEDVSRYQITLHQAFAKDVPDWTGEIVGPPEFTALKTLDLVVAGTNLYAFDRGNKKLWDTRLTFPAPSRYQFEDGQAPCLETSDALYFADKGILTRFDLSTGIARWRLNSVGVSAVQTDDRGNLYVDTTTAKPDSIRYSQEANLRDRVKRAILKVDAATGKVLWRSEVACSYYHCLLSGKFLYSACAWQTEDLLRDEPGTDDHFNLALLKPSSGDAIWNYPALNKRFVAAEAVQKTILLHLQDRVVVLKFFSL